MSQEIRQCAWEIYLKNIGNIYQNAVIYFVIRFSFALFLRQAISQDFLFLIAGMIWILILSPLDLWWRKSLLELIKGECLLPASFLSLYSDNYFSKSAFILQILCQAFNLWFWGIGYGMSDNISNVFLCIASITPFVREITIQPFFVGLLTTPNKSFGKLLSYSWKIMHGNRKNLLNLWASLAGWLIVVLACNIFAAISNEWPVSLLFYTVQCLASVIVLPYITLCGDFFSLRIVK